LSPFLKSGVEYIKASEISEILPIMKPRASCQSVKKSYHYETEIKSFGIAESISGPCLPR